jgi:hypothetical protein
MMLKAQRIDPDTGDYTDCDGDNAYGYLHMDSVSNTYVAGHGTLVCTGFVEERLVDHDPTGSDYGPDTRHNAKYVLERWTQYVPDNDD